MQAACPAPGVQTKLAMVDPHGYLGGQPCYGDLAKRLDARLRRSSQISAGAGEAEAVGSFLGGEHLPAGLIRTMLVGSLDRRMRRRQICCFLYRTW